MGQERRSYWVQIADLERLFRAKQICYLIGGYTGHGNYGDILQLESNFVRLRSMNPELLSVAIVYSQSIKAHTSICENNPDLFSDGCFLYSTSGPVDRAHNSIASVEKGLVELTGPPPAHSQILIYGGGYFVDDWDWGGYMLDEIDAFISWIESPSKNRDKIDIIITGQQVSRAFLSGTMSERLRNLFKNSYAVGLRDSVSYKIVEDDLASVVASKAFMSGDDAAPIILDKAQSPKMQVIVNGSDCDENSNRPFLLNLQGSIEYYATNDREAFLNRFRDVLLHIRALVSRPLAVNLVSGRDDRIDSEIAGLEEFRVLASGIAAEVSSISMLSEWRQGFPNFGRADITLATSYHTALTSLLLCIPTLLVGSNEYYAHKHQGLELQFGIPEQMVVGAGEGGRGDWKAFVERTITSGEVRGTLATRAARGSASMAAMQAKTSVLLFEFLKAGELASLEERYQDVRNALVETTEAVRRLSLERLRLLQGSEVVRLQAQLAEQVAIADGARSQLAEQELVVRDLQARLDRIRSSVPAQLYRAARRKVPSRIGEALGRFAGLANPPR